MSQARSYLRLQRVNPVASSELDRLFAFDLGGRGMVGYDPVQGEPYPLAPHPAFIRRRSWVAVAGSTTPLLEGLAHTPSGGAGARSIAATSQRDSMPRIAYTVPALSGSAGIRHNLAQFYRNHDNAALAGGFMLACRFAIVPTGSGYRWWIGMAATTASIGTTQPSAIVNAIGIGADSDDTTVQLMANSGSGTAAQVDTTIPVSSLAGSAFDVVIQCTRLRPEIGFAWRQVGGGTWLSHSGVFAKAPAGSTLLCPQVHLNAGSILTGHAIEISSLYVETDV